MKGLGELRVGRRGRGDSGEGGRGGGLADGKATGGKSIACHVATKSILPPYSIFGLVLLAEMLLTLSSLTVAAAAMKS